MPAKSRWYTRPRRRPAVARSRKAFKRETKETFSKLVKNFFPWVIGAALLIFFVSLLVFSSYFSVKNIEVVRDNFNVDSAAIEKELGPFIGKNIFFIQKNRIDQLIRERFPEFASIDVHSVFPSGLRVDLASHPIVANLRAYYLLPEPEKAPEPEFTELEKAAQELSENVPSPLVNPLDNEAVTSPVFDLAPPPEPEPTEQKALLNRIGQALFDQEENLELMTISIRGLTQPVQDREQIISEDHMTYLLAAVQYFVSTMNLEIPAIDYLPIAREIHLKTKDHLVIWMAIERDYKEQIDRLNIIYRPAELDKENLAYIDLRAKGKVIYCARGARCDRKE